MLAEAAAEATLQEKLTVISARHGTVSQSQHVYQLLASDRAADSTYADRSHMLAEAAPPVSVYAVICCIGCQKLMNMLALADGIPVTDNCVHNATPGRNQFASSATSASMSSSNLRLTAGLAGCL